MKIDYQQALAVAREAAGAAAALLGDAQKAVGAIHTKSSPKDLVTEWDMRSEKVIGEVLRRRMPEVPILGEESGASSDMPGHTCRWLVDPIDGTVNFAHGMPFFTVSIALEVEDTPRVGVVSVPVLGWEYWAAEGGGAFLNGAPISVSKTDTLGRAVLATGFPYDRAHTHHNFREWEHFQTRAGACRRFGAASLDLAMVACGWLDGYWESRLKPWDLAAGAVLITEAGGTVTNLAGERFSAASGEALATNGAIHEVMQGEMAQFLEGRG